MGKSVNQLITHWLSFVKKRMLFLFEKAKNNLLKSQIFSLKRQRLEFFLDLFKRIFYYTKIWFMMSKNSFLTMLNQKLVFFIFLLGKILRFIFFLGFLSFIIKGSKVLAGYEINQVIFFYVTFVLIDTLAQFLFREVYRFRPLVVSGDFDLILVKPINSLFRILMGGMDIIDLITIPPLIFVVYYVGQMLNPNSLLVVYYILLVVSGLIIAAAFHIAVLSLGIITYRDLTSMGRFPVDIYKQPLRGILTYLIPVGIMVTFPAKGLMGLVSSRGVLLSLILAVSVLTLSLMFWNYALKKYTSASS